MDNSIAIYKTKENINIVNSNLDISVNNDEYFTKPFVEELNNYSNKIKHYSDYVNEMFMYYGILGHTYEKIFTEYKVLKVEVPDVDLYDKVFLSKALKYNIKVPYITLLKYRVKSIFKLVISLIVSCLLSFILPIYILFISRNTKQNLDIGNFCVTRTKATDEKISQLQKEYKINFFVDNLVYNKSDYLSMYNSTILHRVGALIVVPFITIRDINLMHKESKQFFDTFFFGHLLYQYMFRIPFKSTFEYYLNKLMSLSRGSYYTGNKEDRYAICEKRIAKKNSIKTICFPHGLEYAFKEPAGLVGDIFYATSSEAQKILSSIYQENKFIFNNHVSTRMFRKSSNKNTFDRKIVFFTEAQEIYINKKIIRAILKNDIRLFLKLHPKDSASNYKEFENQISILNDINEAINHNICLARKSTILLEAIYNDSKSIAILINNSDKNKLENWFPSLNINDIQKVYTLDDLISLLLEYNEKITNKGELDV